MNPITVFNAYTYVRFSRDVGDFCGVRGSFLRGDWFARHPSLTKLPRRNKLEGSLSGFLSAEGFWDLKWRQKRRGRDRGSGAAPLPRKRDEIRRPGIGDFGRGSRGSGRVCLGGG